MSLCFKLSLPRFCLNEYVFFSVEIVALVFYSIMFILTIDRFVEGQNSDISYLLCLLKLPTNREHAILSSRVKDRANKRGYRKREMNST